MAMESSGDAIEESFLKEDGICQMMWLRHANAWLFTSAWAGFQTAIG